MAKHMHLIIDDEVHRKLRLVMEAKGDKNFQSLIVDDWIEDYIGLYEDENPGALSIEPSELSN